MKKSIIIGASVVIIGVGTFAVVQNNQKIAAQTTTSSFNNSMSAMISAMKTGNTRAANADYQKAYNSMQTIMNQNYQDKNWVSDMTTAMNQNKTTLSAMMSNQSAVSAMTSAMKASETTNASADYKAAIDSMTTIMQNASVKNSDWVNQMSQTMTKYKAQLGTMMSGTNASNMMSNYVANTGTNASSTTQSSTYGNMMNGATNTTQNSTSSNMMNSTTTQNMMGGTNQ